MPKGYMQFFHGSVSLSSYELFSDLSKEFAISIGFHHQNITQEKKMEAQAKDIWKAPVEVEQEKSREEDFSEYLEDLFM